MLFMENQESVVTMRSRIGPEMEHKKRQEETGVHTKKVLEGDRLLGPLVELKPT